MESEMTCNVSEMWSPKMPQGMHFEIAEHPLTMRRVVNLIIAMERFKGAASEPTLSTEFRDENLLNIILENLVEERHVFGCESTPSVDIIRTDGYPCKVTDGEKRSLVRVPNSMQLHAVMLQGGVEPATKVHLNLSTYAHPSASVEGRTVALGIRGSGHLYLSCRKDGDEPTLHLEAVTDESSLSSISSTSDMVRFLFYEQVTGVNITTLMSVAYPNWYISTAELNNKPLEMCLESAQRSRIFNIQEIKPEELALLGQSA